jgi:DNA-binding transcriptional MerR regulator
MRLAELSRRGAVSTATVKYYLREGLLPPGRRISATQAEYGEEHLRRLRLVRALIQVGRMPVAAARDVLAAVDDQSLDQHMRLGAATWALPHGPQPAEDDPAVEEARRTVADLLERLGWLCGTGPGEELSPAHHGLVSSVAALTRLGYSCDAARLLPYARLAGELAVHDLDRVEEYDRPAEQVEAAVAVTVLYEPVLLSLRRLAHVQESRRRFAP